MRLRNATTHELSIARRIVRVPAFRCDRPGGTRLRQKSVGVEAGDPGRGAHGLSVLRVGQPPPLEYRDRADDCAVRLQRLTVSLVLAGPCPSAPARSACSSLS